MDSKLKSAGVSGYNKPKRTPNHPTKSHVVVAKVGSETKTIRFGQQGVSGSPKKEGESKSAELRRESFRARHAKNIAKGKMSAAYWSNLTKWAILPIAPLDQNGNIIPWLKQDHSPMASYLLECVLRKAEALSMLFQSLA
jgi:hypothetical protein